MGQKKTADLMDFQVSVEGKDTVQSLWQAQIRNGKENGNPLQYSCLENSMDRGAWWASSRGRKELDTTKHSDMQMTPPLWQKVKRS